MPSDQLLDVPLPDWEKLRAEFSRFTFLKVLDRDEAGLPEYFLPLARGVVVASPYLLQETEYIDDTFVKTGDGFWSNAPLVVREFTEVEPLWSVERWTTDGPHLEFDEVLVHTFGATPIFATNRHMAVRLALHCHLKAPLAGMRWIRAPRTRERVRREVEYARLRGSLEHLQACSAQISKQLH